VFWIASVSVILIVTAAGGLVQIATWLIAERALQLVGAALRTPASMSIVRRAFTRKRRLVARSRWGALGGLADAVGRRLGSSVVDTIGWPGSLLSLPLGALSLWKGATVLEQCQRPENRQRIDAISKVLLTSPAARSR
jgi:MFS family permease